MLNAIYPLSKEKFLKEVKPRSIEHFKIKNPNMVSCIEKIVVTSCFNKAKYEDVCIARGYKALFLLTGSKPAFTKARSSVAAFKVREKEIVGVKVTLRGTKMWEFFERLVSVYLPRVRTFKSLKKRAFDKGVFTVGIEDINAFPEITSDLTIKRFGLAITTVIRRLDGKPSTFEEAKFLLESYGLVVR